MTKAKPFDIPKREVWEPFKKVKANQGAAGVDGQSIAEFEAGLAGNQALEPAVLGELLPATGATGGHSQGERRHASVGYSDGCRSCRAGGCPSVSGAVCGTCVPRRLLRLPARPLGDRCRAHGAPAVLAV
jgi:hypothetical protein